MQTRSQVALMIERYNDSINMIISSVVYLIFFDYNLPDSIHLYMVSDEMAPLKAKFQRENPNTDIAMLKSNSKKQFRQTQHSKC